MRPRPKTWCRRRFSARSKRSTSSQVARPGDVAVSHRPQCGADALRRVQPDQSGRRRRGLWRRPAGAHAAARLCCLPERDFESGEARAEMERAINALPEKLRAVFVMRELEGLSTEETAEALDVSIDVVKSACIAHVCNCASVCRVLHRTGAGGGVTWQQPNASICWRTCPTTSTTKRRGIVRRDRASPDGCDDCRVVVDTLQKTISLYHELPQRNFLPRPFAAVQIAQSRRVPDFDVKPHSQPQRRPLECPPEIVFRLRYTPLRMRFQERFLSVTFGQAAHLRK